MTQAIKEKDYMLALKYAARILFDKEMVERTGKPRGYDLDKALQCGFSKPGLALQVACGKAFGECTKQDFLALRNASTLVVDYLMVGGELEQLKADMCEEGWRIVLEETAATAKAKSAAGTAVLKEIEDDFNRALTDA